MDVGTDAGTRQGRCRRGGRGGSGRLCGSGIGHGPSVPDAVVPISATGGRSPPVTTRLRYRHDHLARLGHCRADAVSLINTLLGMRIDLKTGKPVIANTFGGCSGPMLLPLALRMVYQVSNALGIPVVGCGGVSCAENVVEMMMAGAAAVEIGAANLVNPFVCRDIIEELPGVLDRYGIENITDIIGDKQNE